MSWRKNAVLNTPYLVLFKTIFMNKFKKLIAWQKAMDLCVFVYNLTESFPHVEKYGLISQITRCAVSVPSNIAEGAGRNSKKEFSHFLGITIGSLFELETQLNIALQLKFINEESFVKAEEEIDSIRKLIYGLKKSLQENSTET